MNIVIENVSDLFDTFFVDGETFITAYDTFAGWLGNTRRLVLVRGNHDISKDTTKQSSLDVLARVLINQFGHRVGYVTEPTMVTEALVIPHLPNQSLFDLEIERAPKNLPAVLHANYNNPFAIEKDHSLNITAEQASLFDYVVMGHEHAKRDLPGVDIFGNQWPSSIADCLGQKAKFAHHWLPGEAVQPIKTWDSDEYEEWGWAATGLPGGRFVRVVGEAPAEAAADVLDTINRVRAKTDAFIVSNACVVAGVDMSICEQAVTQGVQDFDVMKLFYENLSQESARRVRELREKFAEKEDI